MKSSQLLVNLFLVAGLFSACHSKIPDNRGKATALKNGEEWTATVVYHGRIRADTDTMAIHLTQFSKEGFERYSLGFHFIPQEYGEIDLSSYKYILKNGYAEAVHRPSAIVLTSLDDGHVSGIPYRLIDHHPMNYFRITEIKRNGTIKGAFALAFVKDPIGISGPITPVIFPDTLFFENGVFKSILEE